MLVTICTIRQLPQAFALADSFVKHIDDSLNQHKRVLIGLADNPANLPAGFVSPYPLLPLSDLLPSEQSAVLSTSYTSVEFKAACKSLLISEVFSRYPEVDNILYADPNLFFFAPLAPIWEQLNEGNVLLTPFITQSPADTRWPDEKFFQNVGLYCSDFIGFKRSTETDQLLAWWDDRVRARAYIDFCDGLCTDQLWLMHIPVFFKGTRVIKNPGWHVALWNLSERKLERTGTNWSVTGPLAQKELLQFFNFKGLFDEDEGFFPHQNRVDLKTRLDISTLLNEYRQTLNKYAKTPLSSNSSALGMQPAPKIVRGWRRSTITWLRGIGRFIDTIPLPVIR